MQARDVIIKLVFDPDSVLESVTLGQSNALEVIIRAGTGEDRTTIIKSLLKTARHETVEIECNEVAVHNQLKYSFYAQPEILKVVFDTWLAEGLLSGIANPEAVSDMLAVIASPKRGIPLASPIFEQTPKTP